ncbi:4Fe-4S dicluster domain-containing protein [Chloroflexota bacterium]
MFPKIIIDYDICTIPYDCKCCLQVCPQAVFSLLTMKNVRYRETDKKEPGAFKVVPFWRDKCTGCGECIDVCPYDAISIVFPEVVNK